MSLMLEEIAEQPQALESTLIGERIKYESLGRTLREKRPRMIVLVARGSSDNASLFGRYLLEISCGIPVSLCAPSVFTLYNAKVDYSDALVIGVSQSGEGTDINTVLEKAKSSGAMTLGITNEAESSMAKIVDETLLIHAGREKSVAATKTYTGQMLHFYLLANALGEKKYEVEKIPEFVAQSLELKDTGRGTGKALCLHERLRGCRPRTELRELIRARIETHGDLLRRRRKIFICGFLPWASRHRRKEVPRYLLRSAGRDEEK